MNPRWPRRGLYAITPDEPDTSRLLVRVAPVLAAGTALLQYRNKSANRTLRAEQARALLEPCRRSGVALVINDDWQLALAIGADGVHLGEDDGALAEARERCGPDLILGASCYDSIDRARDAVAAGASYVAFGAFFPSITKPDARRASPLLLREAMTLGVPRVAIGGITPANAPALVEAGADLLAVITGVFDAPDPADAVRAYRRAFGDAFSPPRPADPQRPGLHDEIP